MATRRMISKSVIMTDNFLDLPPTTKVLYFFLNLEADDDGFVGNPKTVMRLTGSTKDDMKLLVEGNYVLLFDTGVVVVTDWAEHNSIRKDRKKDTRFTQEMQQIELVDGGKYQWLTNMQPSDNQTSTTNTPNGRIGEDRRGKDSIGEGRVVEIEKPPTTPTLNQDFVELYKIFEQETGKALSPIQQQDLQYMLDDFNADLIKEALREAVSQGKASMAYIKAILNRWRNDNLLTIDLVRNDKAAREKKKQQNNTKSEPQTREEWLATRTEENPF